MKNTFALIENLLYRWNISNAMIECNLSFQICWTQFLSKSEFQITLLKFIMQWEPQIIMTKNRLYAWIVSSIYDQIHLYLMAVWQKWYSTLTKIWGWSNFRWSDTGTVSETIEFHCWQPLQQRVPLVALVDLVVIIYKNGNQDCVAFIPSSTNLYAFANLPTFFVFSSWLIL